MTSIKRKNILSLLTVLLLAVFISAPSAFAAGKIDKDAALEELKKFKHDYLKKELNLSREQEATFFNYYDQMYDELISVGNQTRRLSQKVMIDKNATDLELESAARTVFELKKKEGEIELRYFEEFKNILTKQQLLRLKDVERKMIKLIIDFRKQQQNTR